MSRCHASLLLVLCSFAVAVHVVSARELETERHRGGWSASLGRSLLQASGLPPSDPVPEQNSCEAEIAAALREREAQELLDEDRIVGGVPAVPFRYPFIVNLVRFNGAFCAGSLIAPNVVVTAAHCDKSRTSVWIGRHDLNDNDEEYEEFDVVDRAYPDPEWDPDTNDNDIMLLLLDGKSNYEPVAIDGGERVPFVENVENERVEVTVMGWGATRWQGRNSATLREVTIPGFPLEQCNGRDMYDGEVTENMVCAAATGKDSCQGDSGGPLIISKEEQREWPAIDTCDDVLVGLVSWGIRCASLSSEDEGYPGVYVRLANYKDFIDDTLEDWGADPATYARKGSCRVAPTSAPTRAPTLAPTRAPTPAPTPSPTPPPVAPTPPLPVQPSPAPTTRAPDAANPPSSAEEETPPPPPRDESSADSEQPPSSEEEEDSEKEEESEEEESEEEESSEGDDDDTSEEEESGSEEGGSEGADTAPVGPLPCSELPEHFRVMKALPICASSRDKDGVCMRGFYDYADAEAKCVEQGARLCSMTELIQEQAKNTGCNLNSVQIWSSTSCGQGRHFIATGGSGTQIQCRPDVWWAFGARCCGGPV